MGRRRDGNPPASVATDKRYRYLFLYKAVFIMGFDELLTLVGNYAFPICCCIYLFFSSAKERESHKEEMAKVTDALNANTLAISELRGALQNVSKN